MVTRVSGRVTDSRLSQFTKAAYGSSVTPLGITISLRLVQYPNDSGPMEEMLSGSITVSRSSQLLKQYSGIAVTPSGIVNVVRPLLQKEA